MTDHHSPAPGDEDFDATLPRVNDRRKIDPETGAVRESAPAQESASADDVPAAEPELSPESAGEALAAERLADLQRLQAEYVNYRKRVDRDRLVARDQAVTGVIESLLGVLDDVELARQHGELTEGPFSSIAEKLETSLSRFGWERYGAAGEPFDPTVHEALMHAHSDEVTEPTVVQVLQPGHRVGDRVVRAARVAVAEPGGS
ncbi:nucleotide exchange factor GrpE [Actinotalea sp. K2]|uniref:nucleotide exchange factor GrpE n=1 Tax=Actinotalea sp. K2 TaxID=2939438 RepID=UPI0020181AA9|nr:nucleotide exchange factor GrpE [Actinotalea sp. K2]MCL3859735.1 nucleotide exchange factor GrpE [Actinotalea sp. K2]